MYVRNVDSGFKLMKEIVSVVEVQINCDQSLADKLCHVQPPRVSPKDSFPYLDAFVYHV